MGFFDRFKKKQPQGEKVQLAQITPEGKVVFNWEAIQLHAQNAPEGDQTAGWCKLLIAARIEGENIKPAPKKRAPRKPRKKAATK